MNPHCCDIQFEKNKSKINHAYGPCYWDVFEARR